MRLILGETQKPQLKTQISYSNNITQRSYNPPLGNTSYLLVSIFFLVGLGFFPCLFLLI